jgi:prepilin-type N-terminal cleavage/methylation domain-containing protein
MTEPRRFDRGFTLLELLLAMTALALVTTICYAAFNLGIRAMQAGEVAVVTAQRLRVASDVIIRQLKSAVPYAVRNQDEDVYPFISGTATSLSFITTAGLSGGGGLTCVNYRLEGQPPQLVLEESLHFSPDSLGEDQFCKPAERSTVLLDNIESIKFEYMMNDGAETEWRGDWSGHEEETMPAAVRIVGRGIPGLEGGIWGQEIPLMALTVAGAGNGEGGEVDDEDLAPRPDQEDQGNGKDPDDEGDE